MNHREVVMRRFSPEEIVEIWERLSDGQSVRSVAIGLGRYPSAVRQLVMRNGGALPLVVKSRGPRFLSIFEREEISRGLLMGSSIRFIAHGLKRSPSTISREIQRNGSSGDYYALRAEKSAAVRARRPTSAKLATHPALRAQVEAKLELRCSPQQISPVVSNDLP
jgi:IS30 family transposase